MEQLTENSRLGNFYSLSGITTLSLCRYSKSFETCFGESSINKFLSDMMKESEYFSKVIEIRFHKPFVITKKDHDNLKIILNPRFVKNHIRRWNESIRSGSDDWKMLTICTSRI